MATSLASQLQKLATPQTSILIDKKKRESLLFEPSEAANYGRDVYYDIGLSGFEELLKIDDAFDAFKDSLFGKSSKDFQRAVADKQTNTKLDQEIEKFLLLLSPYLERQAAIKALEWLVYRYMVTHMNRRSLLMCFFPYYESPLFVRVIQILDMGSKTDEWHWLARARKSGRPMAKKTIFSRWANNQDFRAFISEYLEKMLKVQKKERNLRISIALYISTVVGGLCMIHDIKEEHVMHIVKMLPLCLKSKHDELVAGKYLIISQLAVNTKLSSDLLHSIIKLMAQATPQDLKEEHTLCLLTLCQHQDIDAFKAEEVALFEDQCDVYEPIRSIARTKSVAPFLAAYTTGLIRWMLSSSGLYEKEEKERKFKCYVEYIQSLNITVSDSTKVIRSFFESWKQNFKELQDQKDTLDMAEALNCVEISHPEAYSKALTDFISSSKKTEYKKIIQEILCSGKKSEESSINFIHMVHPEDNIRIAAAESFASKMSRGLNIPEDRVQLNLKFMLADDCPAVVVKGLSVEKAKNIFETSFLVEECKRLIRKSESQGKSWDEVKTLSAKYLSENLSRKYDTAQRQDVTYVLLPYVLCPKSSVDLQIARLTLDSQLAVDNPLLKAIAAGMSVVLADADIKKKEYSTKMWKVLPKVVGEFALDKTLWESVRVQLQQEVSLVYQFISLLLLYLGLSDHRMNKLIRLDMAHMVLDFALKSIKNTRNSSVSEISLPAEGKVSHEEFKKYCAEVTEGIIPIEFVAVCMVTALQTFTLPVECSSSPYWMPNAENAQADNLLLLLKATKGAFEMEQYGAGGIALRNKIMASILKDCLVTVERQYYYLAMIWGWHSSLPSCDTVDKPLMVWCLNLGAALLGNQSGNLAWMLNAKEPLVPALISALTSSTVEMRKCAMKCIGILNAIKGGRLSESNHSLLLEKILQHSEEIVADDMQLLTCLQEFREAQPSKCSQVLQSLSGVLNDDKAPIHVKMTLLYAMSSITDANVLRSMLPLAGDILLRATNCKNDEKLDMATSYTLYYIMLRFSPATSEVVEETEGWKIFVRAVTCSNAVMKLRDEMVSPQKVLMEQVMSQKFFASIKKENLQASLWSHLISCVVESEDSSVAARLRSGLRKTSLDAGLIVKEIEALQLTTKITSVREAQAKRFKSIKEKKTGIQPLDLKKWKKLGLMLETIGVMASLDRPWLLTNVLCQCLQQTLYLESVITEVVQQQILSALLHLIQKSKEELGNETNKNVKLNVELIVQCIRLSVSHDTHRRAMLILSLAADIFPELVLHNMMSIFTFMGTSLLRRDDSYSFQVIHQTIQSIVPMLIKSESGGAAELLIKLAKVCQVFVDALPDLPEHRRLPLFIQLANTIDVEKHMWILLALMADSHIMTGSTAKTPAPDAKEDDRRSLPHIIEFALTVSSEFSVLHQVNACCKFMEYISTLPEDIEPLLHKQQLAKKSKKDFDIISWDTHSSKQYFNFKYTSTGLLAHLLSSEKFVAKVVEGTEGMEEELRDTYQLLLEKTMSYLRTVNDASEKNRDKPSGRLWSSLKRKVVDVLDGIISVLPPNMLLKVVDGLLVSPISLVRCRATELLCSKLQPSSTFFSKEDLLDLLPFVDILRRIGTSSEEPVENRQVGLYALQLLIKHLAPHVKIGAIEPVMSAAVQLVCNKDTPMKVVTQALLVIAEAVGSLKAHAVNHLSKLMPVITTLLVSGDTESEHLPLAAATATHKIVENMAQFLSPHLGTLICAICRLCAMKEEAFSQESRLGLRLAAMRDSLPQRIEPRLMIPKLSEAYNTLSRNELAALQPLMVMVETLITKSESKSVIAQKPAFIDLFTQALDLRAVKGDHTSIDAVEDVVCSALAKLLLRLNEHDNIAIFVKLQFWASDVMDTKPSRLITFYRFADHLAGTLKVLFIKAKLADNLYSQASSILERNNSLNNQEMIFGSGDEAARKTTILLKYVIDTLTKIFLHDSVHFTNQERFQLMVQPLINQLENTQIGKESYKDLITNHFIPCVLKFTSAIADDSLWKDLNRAVLLRLRNDDEPLVILAALETFEALIDAFGEDYLQPLLADIMPYITEVFETLDPEIEAAAKEVYNKMESILGDSFRSYLDR